MSDKLKQRLVTLLLAALLAILAGFGLINFDDLDRAERFLGEDTPQQQETTK